MEENLVLPVQKLSNHAVLPQRKSEKAAGYDLSSTIDATIEPHDSLLIPTDLAISIPSGYYGRIAPRSSLSLKQIVVGGGVIDEGISFFRNIKKF